jgi:hypothetical protein
MSPVEWAGLAVAVTTIVTAYVGSIRWLVKHYLSELHKNGGTSLRDSVDRLETQVEQIVLILMTEGVKPKRKAPPKEK